MKLMLTFSSFINYGVFTTIVSHYCSKESILCKPGKRIKDFLLKMELQNGLMSVNVSDGQ